MTVREISDYIYTHVSTLYLSATYSYEKQNTFATAMQCWQSNHDNTQ